MNNNAPPPPRTGLQLAVAAARAIRPTLRQLVRIIKKAELDAWRFGRTPLFYLPQDKLAFINTRKMASTSIKYVLAKKYGKTAVEAPENPHQAARSLLIRRKQRPKLLAQPDLFSFAVVRNPYHRLASLYRPNYRCRHHLGTALFFMWDRLHYVLKHRRGYDCSFARFAELVCSLTDRCSDPHFKSQSSQLLRDGKLIAKTIIRFENLTAEFEPIRQRYQLPPLPRLNASRNKKPYHAYYNRALAEQVYQRYKHDFDRWYPKARTELLAQLDENGS